MVSSGLTQERFVLIQKDDDKTREWGLALREFGVTVLPQRGSPMRLPLEVLRHARRLDAVVVRYLNDYPGIAKSVARLVTDTTTLLLCGVFRIGVVWICHNVDRESESSYPLLTKLRRGLVSRVARRVLVTDPHLVPHAQRFLPHAKDKIDFLTFGAPARIPTGTSELNSRIASFIEDARSSAASQSRVITGICIGSPAHKVVHFTPIPALVDKARVLGIDLRFVIVGPVLQLLREQDPVLLEWLEKSPAVFFHPYRASVDEFGLAGSFDFYYRAYSDLSVPYSVYSAALARKPILTLRTGFLAEMVDRYKLGAFLESDLSNLADAIRAIDSWDPANSASFLNGHTWTEGARRLLMACDFVPEGTPVR